MESPQDKVSEIKKFLAEEFCMDDEEVEDMLQTFIKSIKELYSKALSQLKSSSTDELGDTGHTIKGSASSINANKISSLGLDLENAGKSGDLQACKAIIEKLNLALIELKKDYEQS